MSIKKTSKKQVNSKTSISGKLTQLIKQYEGKTISSQIERNLQSTNVAIFDMAKTPVLDLFDENYFNKEINEDRNQVFPVFLFINKDKPTVFSGWEEYILAKKQNKNSFQGHLLKHVTEEQAILYYLEYLKNNADNPLIQAIAYKKLKEKLNLSYSELSKLIHVSKSQLINYAELLSLPEDIKKAILNHKLSYSSARPLNGLSTDEQKEEVFKKIIDNKLTTHEIEELVRTYKNPNLNSLLKIEVDQNKIVIRCQSSDEAKSIAKKLQNMKSN